MIRRTGAQTWRNIHVTTEARLADLIDIDNASPNGARPTGFELLKQAARDLDGIVQDARRQGRRVRALGSGWALTDIAVTDGWLINTKRLNACFDVSDGYFETTYPEEKRRLVVVAQCGISVGELNTHLEVTATPGFPRALKTSGIGAGQTIAGAISGNTHGSAINFGATPDFVVGLHIVTGSGQSVWIERASHPVFNEAFVGKLEAERIRDDDVFAAAVVSFGAFGVIAAVAIETDDIYQLNFPEVKDIAHADLKAKLNDFAAHAPAELYHYEFIFDPYGKRQLAMEASAPKVPFIPGLPAPQPVWIVRDRDGYAPGDTLAPLALATGDRATPMFLGLRFVPPRWRTAVQFELYRQRAILGNVRSTPGQLFTATVTYFEGYTESAVGVSLRDAATMMEVSTEVIQHMGLPSISQVRVVGSSKALLGFTSLEPKTAVFEFGLANDERARRFEDTLIAALTARGVAYTLHWSKNSGIDRQRLYAMYGSERVAKWCRARRRVFKNDTSLMKLFDNDHVARAGLAGECEPSLTEFGRLGA